MGIGHLFLSVSFFPSKVGVGLKITHPAFDLFSFLENVKRLQAWYHLQPFLLLFTIKN